MACSLRTVFMGTPTFALPACTKLAETFDLVGVMTAPDAVRGRGTMLAESPIASFAKGLDIPVYKTNRIDDAAFAWLQALSPDVICVVAFGALLPRRVLELPEYGCINVHASLLPAWRGAAPIERAILAGDKRLGVSIMQMGEGLDDGDFCLQASIQRDKKSSELIHKELAELGAQLLCDCLAELKQGTLCWTKQNMTTTPYAVKLKKSEFRLSPELSASENFSKYQASSDSYPAKFMCNNKYVRVCSADLPNTKCSYAKGTVYSENSRIYLACSDDSALELMSVKPEGKQEMAANAWARGALQKGEHLWQ